MYCKENDLNTSECNYETIVDADKNICQEFLNQLQECTDFFNSQIIKHASNEEDCMNFEEEFKVKCIINLAKKEVNTEVCDKLDGIYLAICYGEIVRITGNNSICEDLPSVVYNGESYHSESFCKTSASLGEFPFN